MKDNFTEADITIGGRGLTTAQAMTVRVALENFSICLHDPESLGGDETGKCIRDGYRRAISEISRMIAENVTDKDQP